MGYKTRLINRICFLLTAGTGVGVCSAIGVVALVKGGIDFASDISQRDQSGIVTGGLEIGGGLIMAAIGVVIGLFGF